MACLTPCYKQHIPFLKCIAYKWPWHSFITFLSPAFCLCNVVKSSTLNYGSTFLQVASSLFLVPRMADWGQPLYQWSGTPLISVITSKQSSEATRSQHILGVYSTWYCLHDIRCMQMSELALQMPDKVCTSSPCWIVIRLGAKFPGFAAN